MTTARKITKSALGVLGAGVAVALAGYASYVGITWYRYGRSPRPPIAEADPLLDQFLPEYEVSERHRIAVNAPPEITFAAAEDSDLEHSRIVRAIIRTRELVLRSELGRSELGAVSRRRGLLAETKAMGWGVLAEIPGREIVMGAVTKPWESRVVFRAVAAEDFAAFHEPGYVKIVWTLRADPAGVGTSVFRTETRVATTDPEARRKFRRYWAFFSPGIVLIRRLLLSPLKQEAERRAHLAAAG